MSDSRVRRVRFPDGWPRRARSLAVAVILGCSALSGLTTVDVPSPAGARAVPAHEPRVPAARPAAVAGAFARADAPARTQLAAPAATGAAGAAEVPRAAVHTMSMDAAIQHGLTAHQEQALAARLLRAHHDVPTAPRSAYWTPALGRTAVARAESWRGMPYSWAGGDAAGPTPGRCEAGTGGDLDCHVVGFDCSGLTAYAWGPYVSLPHLADAQRTAGAFHPSVGQLQPGDLVFFSAYLPGGTGHVAIYAGGGTVIEAPQSGSVVRRGTLAELTAEDGMYRGAVRPLTAPTPTLVAVRTAVSPAGGVVTLNGVHLTGVDAVDVGGVTVRQFLRRSDTTLVFRAPAHRIGPVAVAVSTSWGARSRPVTVTYAQLRPLAAPTAPTTPGTTSTPTTPIPPQSSTPPAAPSTSSAPSPSTSTSSAGPRTPAVSSPPPTAPSAPAAASRTASGTTATAPAG